MADRSWKFRLMYRLDVQDAFTWMILASELEADEAYAMMTSFKRNGIETVVCTDSEYRELGLPQTYDAKEYYTLGPFQS